MILVTGATGTNGSEILKALSQRGVKAKAMVRSAKDDTDLPDGIEAVEGDFDDDASLARVLSGVERAFLLTPSTEHAEAQQLRFVDAASRAGVRHLVKLSQFAASPDSPVRFLRYHAAVERAIQQSGMAWTLLRPNLFMQGMLQFAGMVRDKGMIAAPIGDARVSVVDVRDNAAVAAAALVDDGHDGKTYTLTGPAALTHAEMAAKLAAETGHPIKFIDASEDDLTHAAMGEALANATGRPIAFADSSENDMRQAMAGVKMPPWQIDGLIEDYAHYGRGEAAEIATGVRDATGKNPSPFDGFARDYASAFAPK